MDMTHRAYSVLDIKAVRESERVIEGIASTPAIDRVGDIVEPKGARFKLPLPLLWQHDAHEPIGHVEFAKPTEKGIPFRARLVHPDEVTSATLKERLQMAWDSLATKLVNAVSIGFRVLEYSVMENGGWRISEWEWLELSAVTIPANHEAVITGLKNMDAAAVAAIKRFDVGLAPQGSPADGGTSRGTGDEGKNAEPVSPGQGAKRNPVNLKPKEVKDMKTLAEQITALEQKRAAHAARMEEIQQKALEEGRTKDEAEKEEFDTLRDELAQIDAELKDLRDLETAKASSARPVSGTKSEEGTQSRNALAPVQIKAPKPEPGIQFARYARSMILAKKMGVSPIDFAKQEYGERDPHVVEMVTASLRAMMTQKGNVTAINTTTDAALIGNEGGFADYVTYLRNQLIVGRFGQNGIPALRRVPFYFPVVTQATGAVANWVAEGKGKPLSRPTWTRTELTPFTVAALTASTLQALRFSSPSAEMALRDDLTAAVVEAIDSAFIDPANNGTAGAKPAAITYGISGTFASSGNDADDVRVDARKAMGVFVAAKNPLTSGVWIMSGTNALALSTMVNALGQAEFPGMTANGGTFFGLPVIASEAAGTTVTLVNAGDIWLADDGGVQVDTSTEASLQMVDADSITQDAIGTAGDPVETTVVSMFQTNSVAIRVETVINWARRRPSGVATITGVTWGSADAS